MLHYRTITLAGLVLAAACSDTRSRGPVVTNTADGRSSSIGGDSADARGTSLVRFINAVPGSAGLDLAADQRALFAGIDFRTVTPYLEMEDNQATFSLTGRDSLGVMATNSEMMSDGSRYTLIARSNDEGGTILQVVRDQLIPADGKARIRVFHAAPGLADVDLTAAGTDAPVFDRIGFGGDGGYKDIDPMTVVLEFRRFDGHANVVRLPSMSLTAGRAYTIILTKTKAGKFEAITFDDVATAEPSAVATANPQ